MRTEHDRLRKTEIDAGREAILNPGLRVEPVEARDAADERLSDAPGTGNIGHRGR